MNNKKTREIFRWVALALFLTSLVFFKMDLDKSTKEKIRVMRENYSKETEAQFYGGTLPFSSLELSGNFPEDHKNGLKKYFNEHIHLVKEENAPKLLIITVAKSPTGKYKEQNIRSVGWESVSQDSKQKLPDLTVYLEGELTDEFDYSTCVLRVVTQVRIELKNHGMAYN